MAAFSPFFIPQKEVELFDALNEELIDDILGQYVDIYKISLDDRLTYTVRLELNIIKQDLE